MTGEGASAGFSSTTGSTLVFLAGLTLASQSPAAEKQFAPQKACVEPLKDVC